MYNSCLPRQRVAVNRNILATEIPNLVVDRPVVKRQYLDIAAITPKPIRNNVSTKPTATPTP